MELYKEILVKALESEKIEISFPNLKISAREIVESECYKALKSIKAVIDDDSLDDKECFLRIEEIIGTFEELGADSGGRHDLG